MILITSYSKNNRRKYNRNRSSRVGGGFFNYYIKFTYLTKEYVLSKKSLGRGYKFNEKSFPNLNELVDYFRQNNTDNNLYVELFNTLLNNYINKITKFHFMKLLMRYDEWVNISINEELELYITDIIQKIENKPHSIDFLDKLANFMTLVNMEYLYLKYIVHKKDVHIFNGTKIYKNIHLYKKLLKLYETVSDDASVDSLEDITLLLNSVYGLLPICKIEPRLTNIVMNQNKFIESGGFGSVFKNETKSQAIKVIDTSKYSSFSDVIHLMSKEVYTYYKISTLVCNHNLFCNFINAYYDHHKQKIFVLMEYCGTDLLTVLDSNTIRQIPQEWFINIAHGIKCMHDNNYVHFDIKPENIVITNTKKSQGKKRISKNWIFDIKRSRNSSESGSESKSRSKSRSKGNRFDILEDASAKLIDFGLSYEIRTISSKISPGTSGYRAPELGVQKDIDYKKCDIYSLGMTFGLCLYLTTYPSKYNVSIDNILTGREFNTLFQLLKNVNLHDMVDLNPDMRPNIDTVIQRLQS